MTEQIAIFCLKAESERYSEVCNECQIYGEVGCDHCFEDAMDVAIQALEKQSMVNEILNELKQYRAIGTVDELQALKEKSVAKKVNYHGGNYDCPVCGAPAMSICARKRVYCDHCGQHLDWE